MIKLLRSNFARLWRSKPFWITVALSFGFSLLCAVTSQMNDYFWNVCVYGMLFVGIFVPLYIGTEYSDGTIRNKLVIGSSRISIYFSNLITVIAGGEMILLAGWLPSVGAALAGQPFGMDGMKPGTFALRILVLMVAMLAMCAIFTMFSMLITAKAANTAISLATVFGSLIVSLYIVFALMQPELAPSMEMTVGGDVIEELVPNPLYISGAKRVILTFINNVLPSGQAIQLEAGAEFSGKTLALYPLYSVGVTAVVSAFGVLMFRRKDLK